jgi:hypothetical protein
MFKNLLQLYALLVCTITSIFLLVVCCFALDSITDLVIPQYKKFSTLAHYKSNERFMRNNQNGFPYDEKQLKELQQLSAEKLTEKRIMEKVDFLEDTKGKAIQELIKSIQWLLVSALFFLIHWKLYKRSTK